MNEQDYAQLEEELEQYIAKHGDGEWTPERTYLECAVRGHPMYGPIASGWGAGERCLCGEVYE